MSLLSIAFEALEPQKEEKMESWEKHYAKHKTNKWQTRAGRDEDGDELDEDELYLLKERKSKLRSGGAHHCPNCEAMTEFDKHDLYCPDCGWNESEDSEWNDDLCAA